MIYITVEKENLIGMIHYAPFDDIEGLGKTEDELLTTGKLVATIPDLKYVDGKSGVYKYNAENNSVYVEYTEAQTRELSIQEEINLLKGQNAQMILTMVAGGLM